MRSTLLVAVLVALATAIPHPLPQDDDRDQDSPDIENPLTITPSLSLPTPTVPLPQSTSLNIPVTPFPTPDTDGDDLASSILRTRSRKPHWEPTPIFTQECKCDLKTARLPCWVTDALQKCYYEENFSYACYMAAAGGCPTPTRVCTALYQPTPRPGRHPCEIGAGPLPDPIPITIPSSVNVTITAGPTGVVPSGVPVPVPGNGSVTLPVVSEPGNVSLPVVVPTTIRKVVVEVLREKRERRG